MITRRNVSQFARPGSGNRCQTNNNDLKRGTTDTMNCGRASQMATDLPRYTHHKTEAKIRRT